MLLIDAEIAGIWHPRKKGGALSIQIVPFMQLKETKRDGIEKEALQIAGLRQAQLTSIEF